MYQITSKDNNLTEGLRGDDLVELISPFFTIDQFQSKMGEDRDVIVIAFRVKYKEPAIDLMEFIERGYSFVLDADMSSGEDKEGQYNVFVEIQRSEENASQIKNLLIGIKNLCGIENWKFRWYKDDEGYEFNDEVYHKIVPTSAEEYDQRMTDLKLHEMSDFFNKTPLEELTLDGNILEMRKTNSYPISFEVISFGDNFPMTNGHMQLDEASVSESIYLSKYFSYHDVSKIGNEFLISDGKKSLLLKKIT